MRRSTSLERLQRATLGPSQRQYLDGEQAEGAANEPPSPEKPTFNAFVSRDPNERPFFAMTGMILMLAVCICGFVVSVPACEMSLSQLPSIVQDLISGARNPITAQDISGGALQILICLVPLVAVDYLICRPLMPNAGSRWFLLHAMGNYVVALWSLPDFRFIADRPFAAMSVGYCEELAAGGSYWACSEWPTALIFAMHLYHVAGFRLNSDDIFHHALFIPIIGGFHFAYPWGAAGNVLCFFISGFPGGTSYFMLAAVKAGWLSSFREKRINCSINTWIRGPGMTAFCTLCICCWMRPLAGDDARRIAPAYFFFPGLFVVFFNGQHYAQRVIGNYYIRKAQMYNKQGIARVDLHTS